MRVFPRASVFQSLDELELHIPPDGSPQRIKEEPGTVIWRETIHSKPAIIKMYRYRGYRVDFQMRRVQREYETLARFASGGIDCTPPLFWACGKDAEHGRYEILATGEIPAVVPLREYAAEKPLEVKALPLERLYRAVRVMHGLGIRHGALSIKNVLVCGKGDSTRFYFVDLSRAILFRGDIAGTRMAWFDLMDLSVKLAAHYRSGFCEPLLRAYGLPDTEIRRMCKSLQDYRATRHTRNRLRMEFLARALCSNVAARRSH